jgi:hypothetical protein
MVMEDTVDMGMGMGITMGTITTGIGWRIIMVVMVVIMQNQLQ